MSFGNPGYKWGGYHCDECSQKVAAENKRENAAFHQKFVDKHISDLKSAAETASQYQYDEICGYQIGDVYAEVDVQKKEPVPARLSRSAKGEKENFNITAVPFRQSEIV